MINDDKSLTMMKQLCPEAVDLVNTSSNKRVTLLMNVYKLFLNSSFFDIFVFFVTFISHVGLLSFID